MGSSSQSAWFQQKYWCSGSRRHWTRIAATYAAHVTIANIILSSLVPSVWPLEAKSEPVFSGAHLQAAAEHMDSKWKTLTMKRMNTGPSIEVMNKWLTVVINIPIHKSGFWKQDLHSEPCSDTQSCSLLPFTHLLSILSVSPLLSSPSLFLHQFWYTDPVENTSQFLQTAISQHGCPKPDLSSSVLNMLTPHPTPHHHLMSRLSTDPSKWLIAFQMPAFSKANADICHQQIPPACQGERWHLRTYSSRQQWPSWRIPNEKDIGLWR